MFDGRAGLISRTKVGCGGVQSVSLGGGSGERLVVVRKRRLSRLSFPRGGRRGERQRQRCRPEWGGNVLL